MVQREKSWKLIAVGLRLEAKKAESHIGSKLKAQMRGAFDF